MSGAAHVEPKRRRGVGARKRTVQAADRSYAHLGPLLLEHARRGPGIPAGSRIREQLVAGFLPVARNLALRYARRGVPLEDLTQVATLGLINAIDRYDPEQGAEFLAFAIPTVQGEIRRYFRDLTWSMRVPRQLKERYLRIGHATPLLSQRLGRAPRPSEIAAHLGISIDEVLDALAAGTAYRATSLDRQLDAADSDDAATLALVLGDDDPALEQVEIHHVLSPLLAGLPARERDILLLRFYANLTQSQIGDRIGISQMHVSRLLGRTLERLREQLNTDA